MRKYDWRQLVLGSFKKNSLTESVDYPPNGNDRACITVSGGDLIFDERALALVVDYHAKPRPAG
jgi:hypothetical protein